MLTFKCISRHVLAYATHNDTLSGSFQIESIEKNYCTLVKIDRGDRVMRVFSIIDRGDTALFRISMDRHKMVK